MSDLDLERIRAAFPSLALGVTHFDGPGGAQVPSTVAAAVAEAMTSGLCQRGTASATERRTEEVVLEARRAIADLVGGDPRGVVFGRSMTQLTFDLSRTLSSGWGPGDEVVVTRLDHDANIRPWVLAAERAGATVRWLGFDPVTAELDDLGPLLSERTRLVAVTAASNLFGTRPDVAATAAQAHEAGALVYVDAVHLAPHSPVDLAALGADLLAVSPYKFFGPHLGALVAEPALLEGLRPDKLLPSSDAVPERFELGTLPYELLAGVTAAVDFIASLVPGEGTRRRRVLASMSAVAGHEAGLMWRLLERMAAIDGVTVHGRPASRTPTVLFTVAGRSPREVHEHLGAVGINAPSGHFYAIEASRHAGLGDEGGVRVGLAAYSSPDDVDRLLERLRALLG
ncbi:cysteine desulfurase-like protein [Nocardioides sp. cx-173]|uniref:cysteine desulfurase-like protein n=1 Tax=Nocardioides sp. cx-173 TaxID=2898796 RepID=UPI001E58C832|nr:cysteine desulfurase-like protein [Nocardioides sp. cx-173]MCD4525571.1 cysteine desulfurase-like protein [Nocardioides sp. cx-173]UGB42715.1 cysteine desulfurase-like protein [Nocardioides sp. cx-173]